MSGNEITLTDEIIIPMTFDIVKNGWDNNKIHELYKKHFGGRYSNQETETQINYAKKKLQDNL